MNRIDFDDVSKRLQFVSNLATCIETPSKHRRVNHKGISLKDAKGVGVSNIQNDLVHYKHQKQMMEEGKYWFELSPEDRS